MPPPAAPQEVDRAESGRGTFIFMFLICLMLFSDLFAPEDKEKELERKDGIHESLATSVDESQADDEIFKGRYFVHLMAPPSPPPNSSEEGEERRIRFPLPDPLEAPLLSSGVARLHASDRSTAIAGLELSGLILRLEAQENVNDLLLNLRPALKFSEVKEVKDPSTLNFFGPSTKKVSTPQQFFFSGQKVRASRLSQVLGLNESSLPSVCELSNGDLSIYPIPDLEALKLKVKAQGGAEEMEMVEDVHTALRGDSEVYGWMESPSCGLRISLFLTEVDVEKLSNKVTYYAILANLRFFLKQMKFSEANGAAAKVSVITIGLMGMEDAYDAFFHFAAGLSSQFMFNTLGLIALGKFVLFTLFEIRYLLLIWKARRQEQFAEGWESIRREITLVYSRFYASLVLGLVILYFGYPFLPWMIIASQGYWIPQIIRDIAKGQKNSLDPSFVLGSSLCRLVLPLYVWGCPYTIFSGDVYMALPGAPSPLIASLLLLLQGVQVGIIFSQARLGPRWFVPWVFLPHVYNYYRKVPVDVEEAPECVICMNEIEAKGGGEGVGTAVTPCNHVFHAPCLEQWMDIKMECPTCRRVLPPIS